MTIASKLFYCRRYSATRRSSDDPSPEDPDDDRDASRRASRSRRSGHENNDRSARCVGTSGSRRQVSRCVAGQSEPETIRLDRSNGEFASGIRCTHGPESSRASGVRVRREELDQQLPCSVLQARARLVERLRDFHNADGRGQVKVGIAADLFGSGISGDVLVNSQTDSSHWLTNTGNKPLSSFAGTFSSLKREVFGDAILGDNVSTAVPECSICLERFLDGENLVCLPCEHRFHQSCLEPWLQAHGVCPYCRAICYRK